MDFQAEWDKLSKEYADDRSNSQMTLGKLIKILKTFPTVFKITGLMFPHSYRGYYCDLAFELAEPATEKMYARDLLNLCEQCINEMFEGYKGGDFVMTENTPVWIASYGCCGLKFIGITNDGKIETLEDAVMIGKNVEPQTKYI